jgi:Family of unknown function (DUF5771)
MKSIMRSGYTQVRSRKRITVRRKDGTSYSYVRKPGKTRVRAAPIPDVGAAGKGPKLIGKLKGGMLTKYGYHPVEATTNRHKALSKGISKGEKPLSVMRRLVAISTLTKRTLPRASRIYKADAMWIRSKYASRFGRRL